MLTETSLPMRALLAGVRRKEAALLQLIRDLVRIESPSDDAAAVSACAALVVEQARKLGGRVKIHRARGYGNIIEARFGARLPAGKQAGRVLILGHLDTVWPLGTLAKMPCQLREGRLFGPGVLDMKAGVAMALTAIELLAEANCLSTSRSAAREIVLLLNSEEEVGSPASRSITERLAQESSAVFVMEPAQGLACKTARKGNGVWRIEVEGVAAHAGVDFERGHSAIRELARQIEIVSKWTDLKRGLTVSVGTVGGGTKTNVVPASAWAEVDVRIARKADGARIERRFASLKPIDKGCSLRVSGEINRPPMERMRGTVRLFRKAQQLAQEIGFALDEAATGGASDGNFTAALGVPTLDGLGAVGEGAHAVHESIVVEHLAPRTALLAGLLAQLR